MKSFAIAAAGGLLLAGCATREPMAPPPPPAPAATAPAAMMLSASARQYAMMTASTNMLEIEKSRIALQRSQNQMVREFAQRMINDHTMLMQRGEPLMRELGLDPMQMQMMPQHRQMLERVQNADPANFDQTYHQVQMMAHQEGLTLQRNYAANGDNPQLRALAAEAAPVMEAHLNHLQQHGQHMMMMPTPRRAGERG